MSELREEAGIAREALVRDKKKTKQQTTLLTKWNIVLDYGESGVGMATSLVRFPTDTLRCTPRKKSKI